MACYITRIKSNLKTDCIRNRMVRLLILRVLKIEKEEKFFIDRFFFKKITTIR